MKRELNFLKPPPSATLLPNHPLAIGMNGAYLLNDLSIGRTRNYVAHAHCPPSAGTITDLTSGAAGYNGGRPCNRGVGARFDGTGYLAGGNPSQAYNASAGSTPGWSIAVKFRGTSANTDSGVVSTGDTANSADPGYYLNWNSTPIIRVLLGDNTYRTLVTTQVAGTWYTVVSTFNILLKNSVTGTESHYLGVGGNGSASLIYQGSVATGASLQGTNLYVASGFNGKFSGDVEYVYIWDRCLTYREAMEICLNPYQMWDYSRSVSLVTVPAAVAFQPAWANACTSVIGTGVT